VFTARYELDLYMWFKLIIVSTRLRNPVITHFFKTLKLKRIGRNLPCVEIVKSVCFTHLFSSQSVKLVVAPCGESYLPGFLDTSAQRLSYRGESCRHHRDLTRTSLLTNHADHCVSLRAFLVACFTSSMSSYQTLPGVLRHVHSMSVELPRSALRFFTLRYMTAHRVLCTGWNNLPSTEYFVNANKSILKTHVFTYCSGPLWGIL
jgi:hypothetical protein